MAELSNHPDPDPRARARRLLETLNLEEKIGQLVQVNGDGGHLSDHLAESIRGGRIGSVINEVEPSVVAEMQRIAIEESRHGIPLLIGRDVVHGFKTMLPIPLGQAATWNPDLVRAGARIAAVEAATQGVNWTFAPMLDVCRDPRWGRIAECFGEDPVLTSVLGAATVEGFQEAGILSCAKHFVAYGASESGRDYNTVNLPEIELRNVYLPPFRAAVDAGALSIMPSFSDLNGTPPTASAWLLRDVLRNEWGFEGLVISDWNSIAELITHGVASDAAHAVSRAVGAGVTMDMASGTYSAFLKGLVDKGAVDESVLDQLVFEVLYVKCWLGLLDGPAPSFAPAPFEDASRQVALTLAEQSLVLLQNEAGTLPLRADQGRIAVIGPLADAPMEQIGTWSFDGQRDRCITPLGAFQQAAEGKFEVIHAPGLESSRGHDAEMIEAAVRCASEADRVVMVLGEEAILSGEAHCRTDIRLPGAQEELVRRVSEVGRPLIAVILAGRPLVLEGIVDHVDALVFGWHPGSMAGTALVNVLFGQTPPSGKLPVSIPRSVGQVPVYYAEKRTGRPATPETVIDINDIDAGAHQVSIGNTSFHLDVAPGPRYHFGYGLTYAELEYSELRLENVTLAPGDLLKLGVVVRNLGDVAVEEVVQVYLADLVASVSRPVRELKAFRRIVVAPGEAVPVSFEVDQQDLAFHDGQGFVLEPGWFRVWVGGSSEATLSTDFELVAS